MKVKVLGAHNLESQTTRLVSLLIDDCLALDAGGLTSSLSFSAQQGLKAILLTHHHYDHIRDVPAIAINLFFQGKTIDIYSTKTVRDALTMHLLNGKLYPKFHELPETKPTVRFTVLAPHQSVMIDNYSVLAVPVNHSDSAIGYQVTSPDGKVLFYSGDTGAGLVPCWQRVSPQLILIEVTAPNRLREFATAAAHLTPDLLGQELASFRDIKGYLPRVIAVHMNPALQEEIAAEIAAVAKALKAEISLASEGMLLYL